MTESRTPQITAVMVPDAPPREPMVRLLLNGQPIYFPLGIARTMLFLSIPEWLRDSTVAPPEPDKAALKQGITSALLEFMRSGFKNLVRLKLGTFMRGIYGPDDTHWPAGVRKPKGREDILPVIDQMLVDFAITQAFYHPLVVEFDENTRIVSRIRPEHGVALANDARNAIGAPRTPGE